MASPATAHKDFVKITPDIISLDEVAKLVHDPKAGAISTFSGTTRDNFEGKAVVSHSSFSFSSCRSLKITRRGQPNQRSLSR